MARLDYTAAQAKAFRAGRTLPAATLERWREAARAHGPDAVGARTTVLDLGSGTGQFSVPLADWFSARVVAVELSPGMREQARIVTDERVVLVGGRAEALPLAAAAIDLAWLSTVVHQFDDLEAAAHELRRVVRPGGVVLVRGYVADQGPIGWSGHFPGIGRSIGRFPTTDALAATFAMAGFPSAQATEVDEWWPISVRSYEVWVKSLRHADSMLAPLTDDEIESGLASIREAHPDHDEVQQLHGPLRLLVLR